MAKEDERARATRAEIEAIRADCEAHRDRPFRGVWPNPAHLDDEQERVEQLRRGLDAALTKAAEAHWNGDGADYGMHVSECEQLVAELEALGVDPAERKAAP